MSKGQLINIADEKKEKTAILVSVMRQKDSEYEIQRSLDELCRLAETAGVKIIDKKYQKREKFNPSTYVGSGFILELKEIMTENNVDLLIFDDELTPAQISQIENKFEIEIMDRTELILNIFYMHAKTSEARMEIRLAELRYEKPRLRNNSSGLDRLGGASNGAVGVASRGSGETKLELDKRKISNEIAYLEKALSRIEKQKDTQSKMRTNVKKVCLIGYTNAGKSTLFNSLTGSEAYVKDQLFATLTSTSRQLDLGPGYDTVLSDTVGFISKLPHQLVASFNATLKEAKDADLLLHVIDLSDKDYSIYMREVNHVLETIGAGNTPMILVFNKADKCEFETDFIMKQFPQKSIAISALTHSNLDNLITLIKNNLFLSIEYNLFIPYSEQKFVANLHEIGTILNKEFNESGLNIVIKSNTENKKLFEKWIINQ